MRMPLVLRTTRVTLRSVAARTRSRIPGCTVGSPPDSIRASILPPSRAIAASSVAHHVRAAGACRPTPGALDAKQVGHSRLHVSVTSIRSDAAVLGLEVAQAVEVAHRDRAGVGGPVGDDLPGGDPPLLELLPQRAVLLVQPDDLAVAAAADAGAGRPGRPSRRGCPGARPSRSRGRARGPPRSIAAQTVRTIRSGVHAFSGRVTSRASGQLMPWVAETQVPASANRISIGTSENATTRPTPARRSQPADRRWRRR